MASYTVGAGKRGCYRITGTANTADTVTFTRDLSAPETNVGSGTADFPRVAVRCVSGGPLYFTVDGTTAAVPSAGTGAAVYEVYAGEVLAVDAGTAGAGTVVSLISSAATVYSVSEDS